MLRSVLILTLAYLLSVGLWSPAEARRLALVIGNSDYTHASTLPNPANDARDLAAAFGRLGYEVELVSDASRAGLLDALRAFRARSIGAEHAVIYYAGHGIEIDRQNFVIPVDAELKADIDVEYEAVPLDLLVAATSGARGLQLVVLDACRDNPFLTQMTRTMATRAIGRGLAIYEPDGNSLVAYAAREGTVALDGSGQNSPYAKAFLGALERPGLEVGQFFRQVRDAVVRETGGQQEPFLYGSLSADPVFFLPAAEAPPAPQLVTVAPPREGASEDTLLAIDLAFWQSIRESGTRSDYEDYLNRFPEGQFRPLAERRLAALAPGSEPARSTAVETAAPQVPVVQAPAAVPQAAAIATPEPLRLSRDEARDLQARLNILGYGAGVEDGITGRRTMAAIEEYKAARGMGGPLQIDAPLLARLASEVTEARLVAHRAARAPAPAAPPKASQPKTAATPAAKPATPAAKPAAQKPAASGNVAAFAGKSYCRSKDGVVLNGRNLSDRPIWCITVLSVNDAQISYQVSQRAQPGKPMDRSTFTRARTGTRTYGSVKLASSGSGSLVANGATFVASQIYR